MVFKSIVSDALKNATNGKQVDMDDVVNIPKASLVIIHGINRLGKPYVLLGVDSSSQFLNEENQDVFTSLEGQGVRTFEAKKK